MKRKKGQVGVEYMIIIGFLTFAIISILAFSIFYSNEIKDRIRLDQVESFAINLVNSAESVFFAGEPSKSTISLYLPEGVENITIYDYEVIVETRTAGGENIRSYSSDVELNGSISPGGGTRKIVLTAKEDYVQIDGN